VVHYSKLSKVVVDAPADSHDAEVAFWQAALGVQLTRVERFPEFHGADVPETGVGLLTQQIGAGPARVHVDIHCSDRAAEVARLEKLGATVLHDGEYWTVMRDPAGLAFCVIPDRRLNESNATAWPS
jgi:predicted enzyme related to lactoylglutathione lyase